MQKLKLFVIIFFATALKTFAQCPVTAFSVPDTINSGVPFNISNTSAATAGYNWDFCTGDLKTIPTGQNIGNPGGLLLGPVQLKMVNDNGNYYAFIANISGQNIIRVDFGASLENSSPTSFAYAGFINPLGVDVIKDGTEWYAMIADGGSQHLYRMHLGSNIANNTSTITDLGNFGFSGCRSVKIATDNNNYYVFVTDATNHSIHKIEFGSSLANAVIASTALTDASFNFTKGFDIGYDCGNNKYVGFVENSDVNTISVIDFGNSLANAGSVVNILSCPSSSPSGLNLVRDGDDWHLLTPSIGTNGLQQLILGNNLLNATPATGFTGTVGSPFSTPTGMGMIKDSSRWYGFVSNFDGGGNGNLSRIKFENICDANIPFSTDSTPANVFYSAQGWKHITLTVDSNGFKNSFSDSTFCDSISIHGAPDAAFSFLNNQCSKTLVPFNDMTTVPPGYAISSWQWNFGDASPLEYIQNPEHAFDSAGTYIIQLIVISNTGISDTITDSITIFISPVAGYSVSQTCVGETTLFTNNTDTAGIAGVTYEWNFGDATSTNITNPSHAYPAVPFTYPLQLIAISPNGCNDTLDQNIRISSRANPGFINSPASACIGNSVQFTDTSNIAAGDSIVMWNWDYGDSTSGTGTSTSHVYAASGIYNVTLTVTSLTSCDTSVTKTVTVLESPVANFSFINACLDSAIVFNNLSDTVPGTINDSIIWYIDGTTFYGNTVSYVFPSPGTDSVTLTVINNFGCSGTIVKQVEVYEKPVASFSSSFACSGSVVNFTNGSFVLNDTITSYIWDFNDPPGSSLENPSHTFNIPGSYPISLTAISSHGCEGSITQNLIVNTSPVFDFSDSLHCFGDSTYFSYLPLISPDVASSWVWNFGDGPPNSPLVNPIHYYNAPGVYTVTLQVGGINSCSKTISKSLTINPKPVAGISANSQNCFGTDVVFTDSSTIAAPGIISQWSWDFGDNSPLDNNTNTSHLYADVTTYPVTHIVISDAGCSDTAVKTIQIEPLPVVSFTSNPTFGSPPLTVQFQNTTTGAVTYQWNFDDGSSPDFGTSPSHIYTDTSLYQVTLIATSIFGCIDSAHGNISVLVPYLDLAITGISATPLQDNLLSISANLANLGNVIVNKFQISAKTENGSPINEQWMSLTGLKAGDDTTYNFVARYEIDPTNLPSYFCVEISEINGGIDSVEINNRKCSAINDVFELFDIYPNPSSNTIIMGMNIPLEGTIEISIYNSAGQLMKNNIEIPVTKGYNEFTESIRNFSKGFYACVIRYRDEVLTRKIIKK